MSEQMVRNSVQSDRKEQSIAFVSQTLAHSEQNYSQIEKKSLALISGVKYFHQYIYKSKFVLVTQTDYNPLLLLQVGTLTGRIFT